MNIMLGVARCTYFVDDLAPVFYVSSAVGDRVKDIMFSIIRGFTHTH